MNAAVEAGTRRSRPQVLGDVLREFNSKVVVAKNRISTEEVEIIKFLADRSPDFLSRLKVVWGQEKPQYTAAPMNLLSSPFLQPGVQLPVLGPQS